MGARGKGGVGELPREVEGVCEAALYEAAELALDDGVEVLPLHLLTERKTRNQSVSKARNQSARLSEGDNLSRKRSRSIPRVLVCSFRCARNGVAQYFVQYRGRLEGAAGPFRMPTARRHAAGRRVRVDSMLSTCCRLYITLILLLLLLLLLLLYH